jgi:lipopolysaccharide transport system ATP-binding protein
MSSNQDVLIKAENLTKRFQLGEFVGLVPMLRSIKRLLSSPRSYFKDRQQVKTMDSRYEIKEGKRYLWALRGINFELCRGERVGIVGRNGAGKSTLLKILIGIMIPTEGAVNTSCRIVPLMGVGAGFNTEMTGRENIFIYGGFLGIPTAEIHEKYDEIVSFAELNEFMDTPVKRFSKGMRARLGMAIALNIAPELLVVDEVLAVGDVLFRAKCMERIEEMCNAGMTLLFVSHSFARVKRLCDRAILLRKGELIEDGETSFILEKYKLEDLVDKKPSEMVIDDEEEENLEDLLSETIIDDEEEDLPSEKVVSVKWDLEGAFGDEVVKILGVRVTNSSFGDCDTFISSDTIILEMEYIIQSGGYVLRPQFQIHNEEKSESLVVTIDSSSEWQSSPRNPGVYRSRAIIHPHTLGPMMFIVGASVYCHQPLFKHARTGGVCAFTVQDVYDINSAQSDYPRKLPGWFRPVLDWETTVIRSEIKHE